MASSNTPSDLGFLSTVGEVNVEDFTQRPYFDCVAFGGFANFEIPTTDATYILSLKKKENLDQFSDKLKQVFPNKTLDILAMLGMITVKLCRSDFDTLLDDDITLTVESGTFPLLNFLKIVGVDSIVSIS